MNGKCIYQLFKTVAIICGNVCVQQNYGEKLSIFNGNG